MKFIYTGLGLVLATSGAAAADAGEGRTYLAFGFGLNKLDDDGLLDGDQDLAAAETEDFLESATGEEVVIDEFSIADNVSVVSFNIITGYEANDFVALEVEGFAGLTDDDLASGSGTIGGTPAGARVSADMNYGVTAFVRAQYPLTERVSVHARAGYGVYGFKVRGRAEFGEDRAEFEESDSGAGLAYGAGAEFRMDRRNSVRADYTRYKPDGFDNGGVNQFSVFYVRSF